MRTWTKISCNGLTKDDFIQSFEKAEIELGEIPKRKLEEFTPLKGSYSLVNIRLSKMGFNKVTGFEEIKEAIERNPIMDFCPPELVFYLRLQKDQPKGKSWFIGTNPVLQSIYWMGRNREGLFLESVSENSLWLPIDEWVFLCK